MIVSLPTPDGPLMMTSSAPGAPSRTLRLRHATPPCRASARRCLARPQPLEHGLELVGERRLRADQLRGPRRDELQPPRVEEQPLEAVRALARRARPVDRVAGDRMAERGRGGRGSGGSGR